MVWAAQPRLKTLIDGEREPSVYNVNWDSEVESDLPVAGGVYISCLSAPTHTARKLVSLHPAEVPAPERRRSPPLRKWCCQNRGKGG